MYPNNRQQRKLNHFIKTEVMAVFLRIVCLFEHFISVKLVCFLLVETRSFNVANPSEGHDSNPGFDESSFIFRLSHNMISCIM